jgi:hypothetical protein
MVYFDSKSMRDATASRRASAEEAKLNANELDVVVRPGRVLAFEDIHHSRELWRHVPTEKVPHAARVLSNSSIERPFPHRVELEGNRQIIWREILRGAGRLRWINRQ